MVRKCKICKTHYNNTEYPFSFCSSECINENKRRLQSVKKPIICTVCGDYFIPNYNSKACSSKCRREKSKKAMLKSKTVSISQFTIFKRDNFRCIYCGKSSIEDGVKLNIDHVAPMIKGGDNSINNVVTSCEKCNLSKQDKSLSSLDLERVLQIIKSRNSLIDLSGKILLNKSLTNHSAREIKQRDIIKTTTK